MITYCWWIIFLEVLEGAVYEKTFYDDTDNGEEHSFPVDEITVAKEILIESTSVKKLDNNKYLIIISSKVPGHIDMAAIAGENELIHYLKNEAVSNIDEYMKKMLTKR